MKKQKVLPIRINEETQNRIEQLQFGYLEKTGIKLSKAEIIIRLIDLAFYEDFEIDFLISKRFVNQFGDLMHMNIK